MRNSRPQCWNMRWTRKRFVNKWRRGEREKRKGNFLPKAWQLRVLSRQKWRRRKEKGIYLLKVETWYGQKPREKKKERKTRLNKKKSRERERERERKKKKKNCPPLWWKLGRTNKGNEKEFVKAWRRRKGIKEK